MEKPGLKALPAPQRLREPVMEALRAELAKPGYDDAKAFAIVVIEADDSSSSWYSNGPCSVHQVIGAVMFLLKRMMSGG